MLSAKRYVFVVIFIIFISGVGGFFSFTLMGESTPRSSINVQLLWQQDELKCQTPFQVGDDNKTWYMEQFQFFISDIEYGSEKAGWQKVNLTQTALDYRA